MYCAHAGAAGQTQSRMHTHASRHTRACTPNPTNRHQGPGGRDTESTRAATARWWAARTSARVKRRRFAALEHASISLGTRRAERASRASRCRASRLRQGASEAVGGVSFFSGMRVVLSRQHSLRIFVHAQSHMHSDAFERIQSHSCTFLQFCIHMHPVWRTAFTCIHKRMCIHMHSLHPKRRPAFAT